MNRYIPLVVLIFHFLISCKKESNQNAPSDNKLVINDTKRLTQTTAEDTLSTFLYTNEFVPNIKELIKLELISKQTFDAIPNDKNLTLEKKLDKIDSLASNTFEITLDNGSQITLSAEKDMFYSLNYLGNIPKMEAFLLYVSDDDNESPYRLYSSITGEKLFHLRQHPTISPFGNYIAYIDDNIMGDGNLNIIKKENNGTVHQLIDIPFSNWEAAVVTAEDLKIKWLNGTAFVLKIIPRTTDLDLEKNTSYLKVTIL
ncbi:hypothetical protein [Aquimarina rhabdastrellae]